jgi:hypothetical protein
MKYKENFTSRNSKTEMSGRDSRDLAIPATRGSQRNSGAKLSSQIQYNTNLKDTRFPYVSYCNDSIHNLSPLSISFLQYSCITCMFRNVDNFCSDSNYLNKTTICQYSSAVIGWMEGNTCRCR